MQPHNKSELHKDYADFLPGNINKNDLDIFRGFHSAPVPLGGHQQ